jgi:hypothetical protein
MGAGPDLRGVYSDRFAGLEERIAALEEWRKAMSTPVGPPPPQDDSRPPAPPKLSRHELLIA